MSKAAQLNGLAQAARRLDVARLHEQAGRTVEALIEAWAALDLSPDCLEAKSLIARVLRYNPASAPAERAADLARMLSDRTVEPSIVARAAWHLLLAKGQPLAVSACDPKGLAQWAENDMLATQLLELCPVTVLEAELALTRLRRWLLLSRNWPEFPRLVRSLAAQATWNGGAWMIDPDERVGLEADPETPMAAAYFAPLRGTAFVPALSASGKSAVAAQYEEWPYPPWSRVTTPLAQTLPKAVEKLDGGRPSGLPVAANLLVAGCGTGREAALWALRFPNARITAIDLSAASLDYARERCRELALTGIDFRQLDLHQVAVLHMQFDFIACSGVLHHLPDPEAGWAALVAVLRPGGAMKVMVYSKIARLKVQAAQRHLIDIADHPVDADLLREARRRLIERAPDLLASWPDFYTLAGVHDLLLHRHEDCFDVPRIVRALDELGLELLAFHLPTPGQRELYRAAHPEDPDFRNVEYWAELERRNPFIFEGMYSFHCRKLAR